MSTHTLVRLLLIPLVGCLALPAWALTPSGPITVSTSNTVIQGLQITNGSGDCVTITAGTNVTIKENEIGPCAGNAIKIVSGTNHKIYDNYIHPERRPSGCCDTGDGIWITTGAGSGTDIQGNIICFGESNVLSQASGVTIHGNYICNPQGNLASNIGGGRGQNVGATTGSSNTTITSNFIYSCERTSDGLPGTQCPTSPNYPMSARQEDSINFYQSSTGLIQNNYVIGGNSESGTAMIADGTAGVVSNNLQFRNNIVHNSAHAGIAVFNGGNHVIDGNKIQNACLGPWRNDSSPGTPCEFDNAISVFDGHSIGCGPVQISNNIADQTRPPGTTHVAYWGGDGTCNQTNGTSGCCAGTGTTVTGNTLDAAAFTILNPIETTNPVPKIPPVPKNCTAVSPYTNQTTPALCGAALSAAPTVSITAPNAGNDVTVSTTPLTTLAGSAGDDVGVLSVTWACPTCTPTSGTATCASCGAAGTSVSWSVASIGLASGANVITTTANDADTQTATDSITVTYTPLTSAPTVLRLVK